MSGTLTTMATAGRILRARTSFGTDRERRTLALHVLMTEILAAADHEMSDHDLRICGFSVAELADIAPGARIAAAETRALAARTPATIPQEDRQ